MTLPLWFLVAGLVISLVSTATSIAVGASQNKKSRDFAQQQFEQSQQFNQDNMALQNMYQMQAEQRANSWNDVGAQVQRGREVGVSDLVALGQGGAGGHMSVSSAPSAQTPQPALPQLFDLGSMFNSLKDPMQGVKAAESLSRTKKQDAETQKIYTESMSIFIDNQFKEDLLQAKLDKDQAEAISAQVKAIIDKYPIDEVGESGLPLYKEKIQGEVKLVLQQYDIGEAKINDLMASIGVKASEVIKNLTEAEDLAGTRDSRNRKNNAFALNQEQLARFNKANADMFEKYGVSYNSSLPGAVAGATTKLLDSLSTYMSEDSKTPQNYVELIKAFTQGNVEEYERLLSIFVPGYESKKSFVDKLVEKFKDVIKGKEKLVLDAIDTSNPGSGIW